MTRIRSLQARLSLLIAGGITVIWLIGGIVAGLEVNEELEEVFDSSLRETAQRILPLAALDMEEREDDEARRVPVLGSHDEYLTYVVRDARGRIVLKSHHADTEAFEDASAGGFSSSLFFRFYSETTTDGRWRIDIAEPLERRREAALEALAALLGPLLFLVPVSVAAVWLLVRFSLGPVKAMSQQIEMRGGGNLDAVAIDSPPQELEPMVEAVNRLLDRLARTLEAERSFTANSAHEIRTPIAAALAQTQRLIAEMGDIPSTARAKSVEQALKDLARLSEKLLQLAKAEGGGLTQSSASNLMPVFMHVLDEVRTASGVDAEIIRVIDAPETLSSTLDLDAFAILLRNLVENALKYRSENAVVKISFPTLNAFRVVNPAPVLSAETLSRILNRFERGDTDTKGAGLGLAIVQTIAAGSGGHVHLISPAAGRTDGVQVDVTLPK